jgi:hypothetical protein
MRHLVWLSAVVLVLLPLAGASPNPVPILVIKLDQPSQSVSVNNSSPGILTFTGNCTVDKLPISRCTVTLTASTDIDAVVNAPSPSTMVFTSSSQQAFTCSVIIPQASTNANGTLTITGKAVANGLQSISVANALIFVYDLDPIVPPVNQTGNGSAGQAGTNDTGNNTILPLSTGGAGGWLGIGNEYWMALTVVLLLAAVIAAAARARRNRRAVDVAADE